jgi:hypothetical protein
MLQLATDKRDAAGLVREVLDEKEDGNLLAVCEALALNIKTMATPISARQAAMWLR